MICVDFADVSVFAGPAANAGAARIDAARSATDIVFSMVVSVMLKIWRHHPVADGLVIMDATIGNRH
ncbi:hypothetical protein SSBR45R_30310 [Bradyrhizobium sp. SSBR45R]|nr:hypothetical protein SSBR45R_30310 [Bradyrhizobium sp. SSBR45R]